MFRYIKIAIIISIIFSSNAFADADDWGGYPVYQQYYGYAPVAPLVPVVKEEFIVTPRGIVEEEEVVYVPQQAIQYQQYQQYQQAQPRYIRPQENVYNYVQQRPIYFEIDLD